MSRILTALALVAFTGAVASAAPQSAAPSKPATKHDAKSTSATGAKAKAHTLTASGTIEAYDESSNTLTLKTAKETKTFTVEPSTKVYMGSKSVSADHLKDHIGARGTVKYSENEGKMVATSVRVSAAMKKRAAR